MISSYGTIIILHGWTTSHLCSHPAWLSSLNNQVIVVHWLMIYLDLHFLVYDYHSLVAKCRHLCSWSRTWIRLYWDVIVHDWWRHSMCLVAYHNCSWSCYSFAVDHAYVLQLHDVIGHITLEKCFNLKHCHFIEWHHWCHRPKQCSSFVIDFMEQDYRTRLLAKFIVIFYIWCCYSIVAYVHLRLRLQPQHLHPSVYHSSAVNLDALHCE